MEEISMTRFEKDFMDAQEGNGIEVITRRREEIRKLTAEGKACRNGFRTRCIAQETARLTRELEEIEELF